MSESCIWFPSSSRGNKENIPKPEYANIWYLESIFTIPAQPKEMLGMMVTKHAQDFIIN
jgi:hypothetical protein